VGSVKLERRDHPIMTMHHRRIGSTAWKSNPVSQRFRQAGWSLSKVEGAIGWNGEGKKGTCESFR
jgi:hypothetical protein